MYKKFLPAAEKHIDNFLRVRLGKERQHALMISMFIGEKTILQLKEVFMQELAELFPVIMKSYINNLKHDLGISERIVVEKVAAFSSSEKLEKMLNQILTKEFRVWLEVHRRGIR